MRHEVRFENDAARTYESLPASALTRVNQALDALSIAPFMGRVFDPRYDSALPPFTVRVANAGRYGIYYTIDDEGIVWVHFIEDLRMDPDTWFEGRLGRTGAKGE